MMKLLVRFLLSFSFFLLGGYAHTSQVRINFIPSFPNTPAFYSQAPAQGTGHINDLFIDREAEDDDDDDESKHHKKSSGARHDGINFLMQASADPFHSLTAPLPFCEHVPGLKFILHCVIRI